MIKPVVKCMYWSQFRTKYCKDRMHNFQNLQIKSQKEKKVSNKLLSRCRDVGPAPRNVSIWGRKSTLPLMLKGENQRNCCHKCRNNLICTFFFANYRSRLLVSYSCYLAHNSSQHGLLRIGFCLQCLSQPKRQRFKSQLQFLESWITPQMYKIAKIPWRIHVTAWRGRQSKLRMLRSRNVGSIGMNRVLPKPTKSSYSNSTFFFSATVVYAFSSSSWMATMCPMPTSPAWKKSLGSDQAMNWAGWTHISVLAQSSEDQFPTSP